MSQRKHESKESNGLFFFERCSFIPVMVCAYKLNNKRSLKSPSAFNLTFQMKCKYNWYSSGKFGQGLYHHGMWATDSFLCYGITCMLLLPVFCFYLCFIITVPVYFGITCFTCVLFLPVSLGVLSTQYPTSPANNSVAPPEENPYTAGNCSELGERLMRKRPTPKDHIRSP